MAGRIPKPWFWEAKGAWYVHLDGERVDLGKDEVAAHRRLHRLMANRGLEEAPNPTVAELAEQYLAELPRRANARTVTSPDVTSSRSWLRAASTRPEH